MDAHPAALRDAAVMRRVVELGGGASPNLLGILAFALARPLGRRVLVLLLALRKRVIGPLRAPARLAAGAACGGVKPARAGDVGEAAGLPRRAVEPSGWWSLPMPSYLEHANITVPDVDAAIAFLQTMDPELRVRRDVTPPDGRRWVHVGNDRAYVALQAAHPGSVAEDPHETYVNHGVNHLGWVVGDHDAAVARLEAAGYRRGMEVDEHPHRKRSYYYDHAGFEWEILEYLSRDPAKFNAYDA